MLCKTSIAVASSLALITLAVTSACTSPTLTKASMSSASIAEAPRDPRLDWWRDARFGLFIHWGLYSVPAGELNGKTSYGEWIREEAHIPVDEYDKYLGQFNPVKFDAEAWAKLAEEAGMKYIVITSKHHDGFCLFETHQTDFDVMSTPFQRDILKELSQACARHGLKMCFYHSIMDWHQFDYLPRRAWEKDTRTVEGADFKRYVEHLHRQITELLTGYGPIGILWFDGEWESTWNNELGWALYKHCRALQPDIIVNNRVGTGRGGMGGLTEDAGSPGDYGTPEQEIPAQGLPGVDWETCMTMNDHWGYNRNDQHWKSPRELIRMLADIASKGGNYLLNVGPTSEGLFPPASVERLQAIGRWMKVNGEAIHGTQAGPFSSLAFGRCTEKKKGANTTLYLEVFDWPADGKLTIGGLGNEIAGVRLLAAPESKITATVSEAAVMLDLPLQAPDADCSVIALEVKGEPIVFEAPAINAASKDFVHSLPVELVARSKDLNLRYTLDGSEPTANSPVYKEPLAISKTTLLRARSFFGLKPVSAVTEATFTKVAPAPAMKVEGAQAGLACDSFVGEWDELPDFEKLTKEKSWTAATVELQPGPRRERYGLRFSGFIDVPADDVYSFALTSDDGSRLSIDGREVVDNDGLHGNLEKRGNAALAAGLHAISVEYFNKTGGAELGLRCARLGEELKPVAASMLKHR